MASSRHHFIPQSHLRRFCSSQEAIQVYDKRANSPRAKSPKSEAFEWDLYSYKLDDGSLTSKIEDDFLQRIDDVGAKQITAILRAARPLSRYELALYVASLHLRNPWEIDVQQATGSVLMQETYERVLKDESFLARLRQSGETEEESAQILEGAKIAKVRLSREFIMSIHMNLHPKVTNVVAARDWVLLLAGGTQEFILSDCPVVVCNPYSERKSAAAVGMPDAEVILPLNPHACLLMADSGGRFCTKYVSDEIVSEVNLRSLWSARRRFYSSNAFAREWLKVSFPIREVCPVTYKIGNVTHMRREADNHHFDPIYDRIWDHPF